MNTALFYTDKPAFGLDIGFGNLKVMQIDRGHNNKKRPITGYGVASFDPGAIVDGVIKDPEVIAKAIHDLFNKNLIGNITTRRVAIALPAARTFNRTMVLPRLNANDLGEAVKLETEQYIPLPIADLYLDYTVVRKSDAETELLAVAVPRKIVDSYLDLVKILGLEPIIMETTISAGGRLFVQAENSDVPTVLIDFGSMSTDMTVFDEVPIVTSTIPGGGDSFSRLIAKKLNVSDQEAYIIKTKYGMGVSKKQKEVTEGLEPILGQLLKEVRRMIRYYEERSNTKQKINQIVTMGGGANMPGLSEYMTNQLRLPVRMCDPWQELVFADLQPPNTTEKSMFVTVAGLALLNPRKIFQ